MFRCDDKYVIQEVSTNRDWMYLTGQLGYTTLSKDEKTRMKLRYHILYFQPGYIKMKILANGT